LQIQLLRIVFIVVNVPTQERQWIQMIRRGVSFFVLEKMAAVLGVSNQEVYAAFMGETIEQFFCY